MEIKGKHIYGVGALVAGAAAFIFAILYWFINRQLDTTVQAGLAIGLIGLALFAWLEIDWLTRMLKTRQARYGAETLALTLMFLVVVVLINVIFNFDKLKTQWDLTEDKALTLAPETLTFLSQMSQPVKVYAFYSSTAYGRQDAETMLQNFQEKSDSKVTYEFVDPNSRPAQAQQYGVTRDGQLIATRGDQREEVKSSTEADLTNAIARLDDTTVRTIYFVAGHGEASVDSTDDLGLSGIKQYLEGVNITVKTLNVLGDSVPVDATAIAIVGPTQPYTQAEIDLLDKYLSGGGKLIVLAEPSVLQGIKAGETDLLAAYLSEKWGITLKDDFIIDPTYSSQGLDPQTINYGTTPITDGLANINSVFLVARSIELSQTPPADVQPTVIVSTMPGAWGETSVSFLAGEDVPVQQDANEQSGALIVGATAENATTKGRVIVYGDSDFGRNQVFQSQSADPLLMLNTIKWAAAKEDTINIAPRTTTTRSLNVFGTRDIAIIFLLACLLPPTVVIALGVSVWWTRRRG